MDKILTMLEKDGHLTPEQIATMLEKETGEIKDAIAKYERDGVILGYQAMVDWDKTDREYTSAVIELKVVPQRDRGFDQVAAKIYQYPEVKSMYLMSGSYDLQLIIEGKTLKEVATFVAEKLAPMEAVTSTATHFVLRKYKDKGVIFKAPEKDERDSCMS
jgi:DNA-binding Lrp family transcriptional regulator